MERDEQRDLVGEILQESYRVDRLVGRGGMGAVYEASHLRVKRRFAIKLLFTELAGHAEAMARFQREAEVTSALGHPHIVQVIDFNQTPRGEPYIVMEFLEGEDLASRLAREGRLPLAKAAGIFWQAASALHAAHNKGVVHRDLKPQNIFLSRNDQCEDYVKVVDFGISKVLGVGTSLTKTHVVMGSPVYMSPEQADERAAEASATCDIYAMGTVLFEMLAGRPPFDAQTVPALLYKIVHEEAPHLRTLLPDLPQQVDDAVVRALSKDPAARFSSMQAFWTALEQAPGVDTAVLGLSLGGPAADANAATLAAAATAPPGETPSGAANARPEAATGPAAALAATAAAASPAGVTTLSGSAGEVVAPPSSTRKVWGVVGVVVVVGLSAVVGLIAVRRSTPGPVAASAGPSPAAVLPDQGTRDQRVPDARAAADAALPAATSRPLAHARRQPRGAVLQVTTLKNGRARSARVYLDGKLIGESPLHRTGIAPGVHLLQARGDRLSSRPRRVRLRPGDNSVVLELTR